jgi:cobalt-zinc-cadmium efflux system outer membrane protein
MRFKTLALAGALAACPCIGLAQTSVPSAGLHAPVPSSSLTLTAAWRLAIENNPGLRARQAQLAAAQAALDEARSPLYNNPELSGEATRREVPQNALPVERRREWTAGLSQTFEIAGQQGHRRTAAEAALAAQQAELDDARLQLRAQVAQAFFKVLALQQRLEIEEQAAKLFDDTAGAVQKRRTAGEDTRLDANVAAVEAERARNQAEQAREQLADARAELATWLQLPPASVPVAQGDLADRFGATYTLESLLTATDAQGRLRALAARKDGAQARLKLEQAARYPDLTVGLKVGREGPTDARERVTTLSVSVPLPLFRHNATGIGQASADWTQAQIELEAGSRELRAQVYTLHTRLQSLQSRVQRLRDRVVPALADNQQLSVKSLRAGQIGLLELIVVNRQALDARRDLVDALADYQATRYALEAAAGWQDEQAQGPAQ